MRIAISIGQSDFDVVLTDHTNQRVIRVLVLVGLKTLAKTTLNK